MKEIMYDVDEAGRKAGITVTRLTGGRPETHNGVEVVRFSEEHNGKRICMRIAGRPALAVLVAEYRAAEKAEAEAREKRMAELFPGLAELRAARDDEARYERQFRRMMESEDNDGARPPRPVKIGYADAAALHPAAAAYLKAESYCVSDNVGKYSAGQRAIARLEAGEDYRTVIAEMEREWTDYAAKNMD